MLELTTEERYELWLFVKRSCEAGTIPMDIDGNAVGKACLKLEPVKAGDFPPER